MSRAFVNEDAQRPEEPLPTREERDAAFQRIVDRIQAREDAAAAREVAA